MKIADILPEKEIKEAVLGEYEKRLVLYKLTDEQLKKKYKMDFKDFDEKNIVKKKGFYGMLSRMRCSGNMQLRV